MLIAPDLQPHVHWTPAHCELRGCAAAGSRYSAWQGSRRISAWSECLALRSRMVDMRMTKGLSFFVFGWRLAWLFLRWTEWWFQKFRLQHDWNVIMVGKSRTNGTVKSTTGVLINHRLKGFKMLLSVSGTLQRGKQRPEHYHFNCENARFAFSHWICCNHSTWHIS